MTDIITLVNEIAVEKERIRKAINNRGVDLPETAPLSEYASKIPLIEAQVSQGDIYWKGTEFDDTQKSYTVPANYDYMDRDALAGKPNLESVNLNNVRIVGDGVLRSNLKLKNVVADNIKVIGDNFCAGCSSLESFENTSAEIVGNNMLKNCPCENITLGTKRIGTNLNPANEALKSVSLPNATELGANAFNDCTHLTSFSAPKLEVLGSYALQNIGDWENETYGTTFELDLPKVKILQPYSLSSIAGVTNINIPNVEKIEAYAFSGTTLNTGGETNSLIAPKCTYVEQLGNGSTPLDRVDLSDGCDVVDSFYYCPLNTNGKINSITLKNSARCLSATNSISTTEHDIDLSQLTTVRQTTTFNADVHVFSNADGSVSARFDIKGGKVDLKNLTLIEFLNQNYNVHFFHTAYASYSNVVAVWLNKNLMINVKTTIYIFDSFNKNSCHIYTDATEKPSSWPNLNSANWHFGCTHDDFENGIYNT